MQIAQNEDTGGVDVKTFQVGMNPHNLASLGQRQPGCVFCDQVLDLPVGSNSLFAIDLFSGFLDQSIDIGIGVEQDIRSPDNVVYVGACK